MVKRASGARIWGSTMGEAAVSPRFIACSVGLAAVVILPPALSVFFNVVPSRRYPQDRGEIWLGSPLELRQDRLAHSPHWIKSKNPNAPAVKREAEEDRGNTRMRRY
jgi:hypothetical protein